MTMNDNCSEFGEGLFIMPSARAGFGDLEALPDVCPDENEKKRFNTFFPGTQKTMGEANE